ncbi:MAG: hypothetical protein LBD67_08380 [Candidatus Accumulibacter sp.]|nr:hypothetical protein [Accumulibacter sp.]
MYLYLPEAPAETACDCNYPADRAGFALRSNAILCAPSGFDGRESNHMSSRPSDHYSNHRSGRPSGHRFGTPSVLVPGATVRLAWSLIPLLLVWAAVFWAIT